MTNPIGLNLHARRLDGSLTVLDEDLTTVVRGGGDLAEVAVNGLDVIVHGKLFRQRLNVVKRTLKGYPLQYTVHAPNCLNLQDIRRASLQWELFMACLEFSAEIRATHFVYHEGAVATSEYPAQAAQEYEIKALQRLGKVAEVEGITICVENNRTDVRRVTSLVATVACRGVGVCCDIGHLFLTVQGRTAELLEAIAESAPYICHVHVHDNFGLGEVATIEPYVEGLPLGEGDLHLPLGWGCIPYRDVFATMKRWYRGAYVLELKPRFFEVRLASTALQDLRNLVQGA